MMRLPVPVTPSPPPTSSSSSRQVEDAQHQQQYNNINMQPIANPIVTVNSSFSTYQVAMNLNDAACTLSEHGDYDNAVELMREAMLAASNILNSSSSTSAATNLDTSCANSGVDSSMSRANLLLSSLKARGYTSSSTASTTSNKSDDDSSNSSSKHDMSTLLPVYHAEMSPQAHLQHVRFENDTSSCSSNPSRLSAVLMFNLGVIYRKTRSIHDATKLNIMAVSAARTGNSMDTTCPLSSCPSQFQMVYLYALNNLAECYYQHGQKAEAADALTEAAIWASNILQSRAPCKTMMPLAYMLVKLRSNLGLLQYQAGDMDSCLHLLNDVLCINKSYEASSNFSTVQILYNIGLVLESSSVSSARPDLLDRAREMYESAHDIVLRLIADCSDGDVCERYGGYAPRIAVVVINKVALLNEEISNVSDDSGLAIMMLRHKSLEQKLDYSFRHGLDGADLAAEINGLGAAYSDRDEHDKALSFYSEGLRLEIAVLGKNHPNVLITLNNIGQSLHCEGRYASALNHYKKALGIRESLYSHYDHLPVVPTLMHNVALIYMHTGRQNDALPYFQSSVTLQRTMEASGGILCDKDVLASSLYNVGVILADRGWLEEALRTLTDSVSIRRSTVDADDIDIAETLVRVAQILQAKGENMNALAVYQGVLDLNLPATEEECRETVILSLCNMAQICYSLANLDESLRYYCWALNLIKESVSLTEADIDIKTRARLVSILGAVAGIYSERGEVAQAEAFFTERTRVQRVGYGEEAGRGGSNMTAPAA